jgi:clan AA aspartic protease
LIDTGFTGFLMMPERDAQRLGIRPDSVLTYTLADGRGVLMQTGVGLVEIPSGEMFKGTIVLGNAAHALLGMQFLRKAGKALYADRKSAVLINEVAIEALERAMSSTG